MADEQVTMGTLQKDIEYIKGMLEDLKGYFIATKQENNERFVTKDQFLPVKLITYGMVALILISVLSGLLQN